jgi:RNA polymerase primary sigma factor
MPIQKRKKLTLVSRAQRVIDQKPARIFHHPFFNIPQKKSEILGDMPGQKEYDLERERIRSLRNEKIPPEMKPCYDAPLLTKEQEFHLFRKMNFYKYLAHKKIGKMDPKKATKKRVVLIEGYLAAANEVRSQIASSNFRLATTLVKNRRLDPNYSDSVLSTGYTNILKAVDYFDYNLGNKFSTYATWVLRQNHSREWKTETKWHERFTTGGDIVFDNYTGRDPGYDEELDHKDNKRLVAKLFSLLARKGRGDVKRQIFAIKNSIGFGVEPRTLKSISEDMGVTKERVRQLKAAGLKTMRDEAERMGLSFDFGGSEN